MCLQLPTDINIQRVTDTFSFCDLKVAKMNLFELGEGHVNKYWKKSAVKNIIER